MSCFRNILLMIILMLTCASFAFDRDFVDANLWHGYFDIMNLLDDEGNYEKSYSTMDSIDGIYLFVEGGWDGPCCVSPYHLRLSIGKNMMRMQKDSVWVLVNSADSDSLNFELKKGNALSLEKFKKLEFDSSHVQYRIDSSNPLELDIDIQKDSSHFYYYVLYQTENSIATLCGIVNAVCYYQIGCIYRNDGSLNFDSLPDPMKLNRIEDCPESGGSSLQPMIRGLKKQNELEQLYKVNGTPVSKGSSNIVFQNKQPKLQLKGKR